jgi:hypothetical protein
MSIKKTCVWGVVKPSSAGRPLGVFSSAIRMPKGPLHFAGHSLAMYVRAYIEAHVDAHSLIRLDLMGA